MTKRYARNLGTLGEEGQRKLFGSHVAIVGAGGLGGTVFEILLRYGVGKITLIDFDVFDETNLNRQILSSTENIACKKVDAARERAAKINPGTEVVVHAVRLSDENAHYLIGDADIICDCLDDIHTRFALERAAKKAGTPLVHASVGGLEGRIMVIFPNDAGLSAIYGDEKDAPKKGEETKFGNPPSSVFTIAALEAHAAIQTLTASQNLRGRLIKIDLSSWKITNFVTIHVPIAGEGIKGWSAKTLLMASITLMAFFLAVEM